MKKATTNTTQITHKIKRKIPHKTTAINSAFFNAIFTILAFIAFATSSTNALDNAKSSQLKKDINTIQNTLKSNIDTISTRLHITLEAENKGFAKATYSAMEYEHFYHKFKEKNANMHEISKSRNKIMLHFINTAKEVANAYSVADEFVAFEEGVSIITEAFLAKIAQSKAKLDKHEFGNNLPTKSSTKDSVKSLPTPKTQENTLPSPKSNTATDAQKQSLYQEKIGYILAEFENEYMGLVSDAYSEFSSKIKAHFDKNKTTK
ncbi:hypothetical protein [Helicobacter sp. T3_23-1059]